MSILHWIGNFFDNDGFDRKQSQHTSYADDQLITALVRRNGKRYRIKLPKNSNLLKSLKPYTYMNIPFSCEGGVCTTCRVKLVTGDVNFTKQGRLSDQEKEGGWVLTCQCIIQESDIELNYDD